VRQNINFSDETITNIQQLFHQQQGIVAGECELN